MGQRENGELKPSDVLEGSHKYVWWKCQNGHSWRARILSRSRGAGCPVCTGKAVMSGENDLATLFPDIAAQWDTERNGSLRPDQITSFSNRKVWWRCTLGHEWQAIVAARAVENSGCPYCAGRRVLAGFNDLATLHPKIAAQWDSTLNSGLTPEMVTPGSHKRVWWKCAEGHVWKRPSTPEPESRNVDVPYAPEKQHDKSNMSSIRPTTYSGFSGFIIHTN